MRFAGGPRRAARRAAAFVGRHPDLVALVVLLAVGGLVRVAFVFRAPLFLRPDSVDYFQAGYDLARGQGFDLPLRRTPLYPLFIAVVVGTLGEDPRALAFAQHALGLVTVAATYFLGRAIFGRPAGALAGLLVAVSAPLLIYEQYILAEALFIPLLAVGLMLAVVAMQRQVGWLYVTCGVVLALAALARPIGQAVLVAVPLAILVRYGRSGMAARSILHVLIGCSIVLVPWIARGALVSGEVGSAGAVGQSLIGRIIRHDEGFVLPDPASPTSLTDPRRIEARRLILTLMARDLRPSVINYRVRNQLGFSEAEANVAMRDVALEIFADQWRRYLEGTTAKFRRLLIGEDERLRVHWSTRKDGEIRDGWISEASIAHLYRGPSAVEELEYPVAELLTRIFQPYHWRWPLAVLVLVGVVAGLRGGQRDPICLMLVAAVALVLPSAALVGYVPRYRYPADPLLAVMAAGGIVAIVRAAGAGARAWRTAWNRRGVGASLSVAAPPTGQRAR